MEETEPENETLPQKLSKLGAEIQDLYEEEQGLAAVSAEAHRKGRKTSLIVHIGVIESLPAGELVRNFFYELHPPRNNEPKLDQEIIDFGHFLSNCKSYLKNQASRKRAQINKLIEEPTTL